MRAISKRRQGGAAEAAPPAPPPAAPPAAPPVNGAAEADAEAVADAVAEPTALLPTQPPADPARPVEIEVVYSGETEAPGPPPAEPGPEPAEPHECGDVSPCGHESHTAGPPPAGPAAEPEPAEQERWEKPRPAVGDPDVVVASPSMMAAWLAEAAASAGEPISFMITAYGRDARVNVPDAPTFRAWCAWLHLDQAQVVRDRLGTMAEASVEVNGWVVQVALYGKPVEELG